MRRLISWLILGSLVLFCTKILNGFYFLYNSLMFLMEDHIPFLYRAFRIIEDTLGQLDILDGTVQAVLAGLIVFGLTSLAVNLSSKISRTRFGARFFFWSTVSFIRGLGITSEFIYIIIRLHFFEHLSFSDIFVVNAANINYKLMFCHIVCYFMIAKYLDDLFFEIGSSSKILFGHKDRIVLGAVPKTAKDKLISYGYITPAERILDSQNQLDLEKAHPYIEQIGSYLKKAKKTNSGIDEHECVMYFGRLESLCVLRYYDVMQIYIDPKTDEVYVNRENPLCNLLRLTAEKFTFSMKDLKSLN